MGATCFNGGATHFIAPSELYDAEKMSNPKNAYFENGKFMWRVNGVRWFTNMEHNKQHIPIDLYKKYSADEYPKYDNYFGFNVNKVIDIPVDDFIDVEIPDEEYEKWKKVYGDDLVILE